MNATSESPALSPSAPTTTRDLIAAGRAERRALPRLARTATAPIILDRVASASTPGAEHIITMDPTGVITCDCKGFTYRANCRHVTEVRARLAQPVRPAVRVCEQCGFFAARELGCFCSDECGALAMAQDAVAEAEAMLEAVPAPKCPGYLRQHAAPADEMIRFYCAACDEEAVA